MKKWILGLIVGVAVVAAVVVAVVVVVCWSHEQAELAPAREEFILTAEYYGAGEVRAINAGEFARLMTEKQSFVVILRMVVCPAEFPITTVAKTLAEEEKVTFLELTEAEFKQTELAQKVKYLPSAVIVHEGEVVDFLDAEDDADVEYYKSAVGLKRWLTQNGVEL